jgi:uncharacterized membrane protein
MKTVNIFLLGAVAGSLAFLATGCTATDGQNSNVSLLMPGKAAVPSGQSDNDQGFYQPPRDPQFNTARDQ